MRAAKNKAATLILSFALLLGGTGCDAKPLAEREIVRGIFFTKTEAAYTAVLLLQNTEAGAEAADTPYKTESATALTPAQALRGVEEALPGEIFYGLADLLCLPGNAAWQQVGEMAQAARQAASPGAELAVVVLDAQPPENLEKNAAELYDTIRQAAKKSGLQSGVEQLFAQTDGAALPWYHPDGWRYRLLVAGEPGHGYQYNCTSAVAAQLAAVLSGQSGQFDFTFAGDSAAFRAEVRCFYTVEGGAGQPRAVVANLLLREPDITRYLGGGEAALRRVLEAELADALNTLLEGSQYPETDLFHFAFWAKNADERGFAGYQPQIRLVYPH
ncbi:MAG: hypothetical protein PHO10_06455 [Gemmiger sp.]|nr:hypothetical protein [Gemmiger sp.]